MALGASIILVAPGCGGGGGAGSTVSGGGTSNPGSGGSGGTTNPGSGGTGGTTDPGSGGTGGTGTGGTTPPVGSFPANSIIYSDSGTLDAWAIGGGVTALGSVSSTISAVMATSDGGYLYAYQATPGVYQIMKGTTLDPSKGTQVGTDVYDSVTMLEAVPTANRLFWIADVNGDNALYTISTASGSTPHRIDTAESGYAAQDGTTVYTQPTAIGSALMIWNLTTGQSSQLVDDSSYNIYPQLSKDGKQIVFSSDRDNPGGCFDLYEMPVAGTPVTRLTSTDSISEVGASFDGAGTSISFIGLSGDSTVNGLYTMLLTGSPSLLAALSSPDNVTYWTTADGRSRNSRQITLLTHGLKRRRH